MLGLVEDHEWTRIRWYLGLKAGLVSAGIIALTFLVAWLPVSVFDVSETSRWVDIPVAAGIAIALFLFGRTLLTLWRGTIEAGRDWIALESNRARIMVPFDHVEYIDTYANVPLRLYGLRGLVIHTGSGIVDFSPVSIRVSRVIEEMIRAHHAAQLRLAEADQA